MTSCDIPIPITRHGTEIGENGIETYVCLWRSERINCISATVCSKNVSETSSAWEWKHDSMGSWAQKHDSIGTWKHGVQDEAYQ